jgi:hypothetical protein
MTTVPKCREGKKVVAGYFDPIVSRKLRQMAVEEDSSVQALLEEAISDLMAKRAGSAKNDLTQQDLREHLRLIYGTLEEMGRMLSAVQREVQSDIFLIQGE